MTTLILRRRIAYRLAAFLIVLCGLCWRSHWLPLSIFLRKYGGDALWAAMVYAIVRLIRPQVCIRTSAFIAFAFAVIVEFSQLCHAPWIEAVRAYRLGLMILGSTFNWPDIPAYAVGVALAAIIDKLCTTLLARRPNAGH